MQKPKANNKVRKVMKEFKAGTLHAGVDPKGPKKAKVVTNPKQAIAIALSQAGIAAKGKGKSKAKATPAPVKKTSKEIRDMGRTLTVPKRPTA